MATIAYPISTELRDALDQRISEYEHNESPAQWGAWTDKVAELLYEIQAITE